MMKFKYAFFVMMFFIAIFLNGCEAYRTLYNVTPTPVGEVVKIPEEIVVMENITEEKPTEEKKVEEEVGKANVIIVQETDLVSLAPRADDPDKDKLTLTFTSPLDENGRWQTKYGDAGEYTITITVSDGTLTDSKDILIIVNKKEEAPTIDKFSPEESTVSIDEAQSIDFSITASDLNKDKLSYKWKLDGTDASNEDFFSYKTNYNDAGSHTVKAVVSDGASSSEKLWSVTINNVNRKPVLEIIDDISVKETEKVILEPKATDPDGDKITYSLSDERFTEEDGKFIWQTTYDDSGEYVFTVSASDGTESISQDVKVTVDNVNRPPAIVEIIQQ